MQAGRNGSCLHRRDTLFGRRHRHRGRDAISRRRTEHQQGEEQHSSKQDQGPDGCGRLGSRIAKMNGRNTRRQYDRAQRPDADLNDRQPAGVRIRD
jgi:hypothetical protein